MLILDANTMLYTHQHTQKLFTNQQSIYKIYAHKLILTKIFQDCE